MGQVYASHRMMGFSISDVAQDPRESHRTEDPGIGTTFGQPLDRLLQRDGMFAVDRIGEARGLREVIIATYLSLNLTFGSIYMLVGVGHLGNADLHSAGSRWLSAIVICNQTATT